LIKRIKRQNHLIKRRKIEINRNRKRMRIRVTRKNMRQKRMNKETMDSKVSKMEEEME